MAEVPGCPGLVLGSSCQRSTQRRRAFMKKLLTVESSSPSCCEMVICISLLGRLFSLKMAMSVRRCRSVKTSRCFLGARLRSLCCSCSFLLQADTQNKRVTDTLNRNTDKATNQNIDRSCGHVHTADEEREMKQKTMLQREGRQNLR